MPYQVIMQKKWKNYSNRNSFDKYKNRNDEVN